MPIIQAHLGNLMVATWVDTVGYFLFTALLVFLVGFIILKIQRKRREALADAGSAVAGEDEILGQGAKDPEQFDEPDEEALEEMADLLGENEEESTEED